MKKLSTDFIIQQYQSGVENYTKFTTEVGLWASEKYVFDKYLNKQDKILDLGCGTGRTTFHLYQSGYHQIIGVDLTPEMIAKAIELNKYFQVNILFKIGDARNLEFNNQHFDAAIFSFNGIMSIPNSKERRRALKEINRVIKKNSIFIFTTHDRDKDENYFEFWKEQKKIWDDGKQDSQLYEFGDLITTSKNEERSIYIHIPNKEEVEKFINEGGFEVLETFYRNDQFQETEKVKDKSGECRFWVTRKK